MSYGVSHSFEELALLAAENGHRVLGEGQENSLVTEALISQILEVSILLELDELLHVVLIQRICRLQVVDVHILFNRTSTDSTSRPMMDTEVLRASALLELLFLLSLLSVGLSEATSAFPAAFVF